MERITFIIAVLFLISPIIVSVFILIKTMAKNIYKKEEKKEIKEIKDPIIEEYGYFPLKSYKFRRYTIIVKPTNKSKNKEFKRYYNY